MKVELIYHDITQFSESVDVIVNAANESLLGGGGVDGSIHRAAGPELVRECRTLGGCKPGDAKVTKAYRLPQKYIIHAVGPRYESNPTPKETLRSCYQKSLELADNLGCKVIAFPSISTGVFHYPYKEAAEIVAEVLFSYKPKHLTKAIMVVYPGQPDSEITYESYQEAFKKYE
jgi:O-acetyl-ADP-ribose deacetylase (regulator of RNase III)